MNIKPIITFGLACALAATGYAQSLNVDDFKRDFNSFVNEARQDFNNFRQQAINDFNKFLQNPWVEFDQTPPVPTPDPTPTPPVVYDEPQPQPQPIEDTPVVIDQVIPPVVVDPQPQPIEPIEEVPVVTQSYISFSFFGTKEKVRSIDHRLPTLSSTSERGAAQLFQAFSDQLFDNVIYDCLKIRTNRQLCDWSYLQMLDALTKTLYPNNPNEQQLLLAYLFLQSGYRMRLAYDNSNIYMLYASKHMIFEQPSFYVDGYYYYSLKDVPSSLHISQAAFPGEQALSLWMNRPQVIDYNASTCHTHTSSRYSSFSITSCENRNLIDFYATYPSSSVNNDFMTRWAMYAETPLDPNVKKEVYTQLTQLLSGKSEFEAVNIILNWIQTGFEYEYDNQVWGYDRAFFPEETLFYPYCDCEDRAILFARLVRDIVGLDCLLVYYPGHLAAAVAFSDPDITGDFITLNNRKFTVADPTYINAPVGKTMPSMRGQSTQVYLLKK